jgi:hypothetical protein
MPLAASTLKLKDIDFGSCGDLVKHINNVDISHAYAAVRTRLAHWLAVRTTVNVDVSVHGILGTATVDTALQASQP